MFKIFTPIVIAATSLVAPVQAGIHDFTPENVGPQATATAVATRGIRGDCFTSQDNSRVCWYTTDNVNYTIAAYDVEYPSHPAAFNINCQTGVWTAYANMPKSQMRLWANTFCEQF